MKTTYFKDCLQLLATVTPICSRWVRTSWSSAGTSRPTRSCVITMATLVQSTRAPSTPPLTSFALVAATPLFVFGISGLALALCSCIIFPRYFFPSRCDDARVGLACTLNPKAYKNFSYKSCINDISARVDATTACTHAALTSEFDCCFLGTLPPHLLWAPAPHHTLMKNAEAKTRFSAFRGIRIRWAPFSRRVSTRRLSQVLPPVCMPQHVKSQALSLMSLLSLCHPRVKLCFYYSNVHVGRRCACDSCRFIPNTKDVVYSHHNLA